MKKAITVLSTTVASLSTVTVMWQAAPTIAHAQSTQTITLLERANPSEQQNFAKLIAAFEKQNPSIKVNAVAVPPANYQQKLDVLTASGNAPDVYYLGGTSYLNYVSNGKLLDLQPYLKKDKSFNVKAFYPTAIKRYQYNADYKTNKKPEFYDGDIYGLPKDIGPWAFVINTDVIMKAHVPLPSSVPGKFTWDQFLADAKRLTVKDNNGNVTQFGDGAYNLESAVWSNGGEFINMKTGKIEINKPAFYNAMQFVANLATKYHVSPTPSESQSEGAYQRFLAGKEAMFAMGAWDQTVFWTLPFHWDIIPWPVSPRTHKEATWLGSEAFVVSKQSANPSAAVKLAEFLSIDPSSQLQLMKLGQSIPDMPSLAKDYLKLNHPPKNKQVFLDIMSKYGRPQTADTQLNTQWLDTFNQDASVVWEGKETAKQFCIAEAPKLQQLYDKYNKQ